MPYEICKNKQTGFTLLELLLVVAMIGLIAMFSVSLGSGFIWRTDLSSAQSSLVASLRRAQVLARSQADDIDWGVHIENNQLTIFQGNNFPSRNVSQDEEYNLGSVVVSAPTEVIYHKFSGAPYENSYTISLASNGEISVININSEGMISY